MKKRLARTPNFNQVKFEQNQDDLRTNCNQFLIGDWTLINGIPKDKEMGTTGFLAVDRDICNDDNTYKIYLCEIFQYNKDDEAGRVECGVLVYEYTNDDTAGGLVCEPQKISGKASTIIPVVNGEWEIKNMLNVVRLDAKNYNAAVQQANKWFETHTPPSKRNASTRPRLTRN